MVSHCVGQCGPCILDTWCIFLIFAVCAGGLLARRSREELCAVRCVCFPIYLICWALSLLALCFTVYTMYSRLNKHNA
jgi:hypothetical protein